MRRPLDSSIDRDLIALLRRLAGVKRLAREDLSPADESALERLTMMRYVTRDPRQAGKVFWSLRPAGERELERLDEQ